MAQLTIGIDIDGTLTKYPEFFIELGRLFRQAGHKVYLITGLGISGLQKRREQYWDKIFMDTSFYDDIYTTEYYNQDEIQLIGFVEDNEEIVGRFKQRMCLELGVDIMFDDKAAVHRNFGNIPIFEVK